MGQKELKETFYGEECKQENDAEKLKPEGSAEGLQSGNSQEREYVLEEITEFALDLLEGSKNLKNAIRILLAKVGRRFDLSCVLIWEEQREGEFRVSYLWYDKEQVPKIHEKMNLSSEERKQIVQFFRTKELMEFSKFSELPKDDLLYRIYEAKGLRSLLQCPLLAKGEIFGYISYADCVSNRTFGEAERRSMMIIGRIIGNYLARERYYREIERKFEKIKNYDEITGLMRYERFKDVAQEIVESADDKVKYAVISVDIAHFKYFNELYGFRSGDEVLNDFATLVVKNNPRAVAACRDYADHFLILVKAVNAETVYHNVVECNRLFTLQQNEKHIDSGLEMCCGIYVIENPEIGIIKAIDNAHIARKIIKEKKGSGELVFEPSMKINRLKEIALMHMIEEAIEDGEFCPYLQPKISLETGKLIGAEALARWIKPNGKMSPPDEFIPPLEKSGKIVELDFYMYDAILRKLKEWKQKGYQLVPISVNLSRHHMKNPELVDYLVRQLERYGLSSDMVEIEITESAFIEDQDALIQTMKEIKNRGFEISIDDFGKGYSSLSMLTELPADIVKIDKDFLKNSSSVSTQNMLNNVIQLIKDNHMRIVCEGVETKEQVEFLAKTGCDVGQGYYFAKPMRADEFEAVFMKEE